MRWPKRIGVGLVVAVGGWLLMLVLVTRLGDGCVRDRFAGRVANRLAAEVKLAEVDLGLVVGELHLRGLEATKVEHGRLELKVEQLDAELAPMGLALVRRDLGRVALRGVTVQATTRGVLSAHGDGDPLRVEEFVLDDGRLELSAGVLVPAFAVKVTVDHARSGPTTLHTPLSWLLTLRELDATVELPVGGDVRAHVEGGVLSMRGGMLGDEPVRIELDLAPPKPGEDAAEREFDRLADLGERIARQGAIAVAKRLLGGKP
ncbi:MAG: hypothetical protein R2939_19615 [Kofleriaceae bacterium]